MLIFFLFLSIIWTQDGKFEKESIMTLQLIVQKAFKVQLIVYWCSQSGYARAWIFSNPCSDSLSLREFAERTLENLRKKLRQKVTKNATKSAEWWCRTFQEFAELFAENCGFGPNHEICCIVYLLGSRTVQITYRIMERTAWKVHKMWDVECRKQQKTRKITDFAENRGFGPKSRNLLHPWNRDFLEGQDSENWKLLWSSSVFVRTASTFLKRSPAGIVRPISTINSSFFCSWNSPWAYSFQF